MSQHLYVPRWMCSKRLLFEEAILSIWKFLVTFLSQSQRCEPPPTSLLSSGRVSLLCSLGSGFFFGYILTRRPLMIQQLYR